MKTLLPAYERELGMLRDYAREFARQYPKLAGQLGLRGGVCEDPHIERWIEASALLNARTRMQLDARYPDFTAALLDVNYPHYLQPFPSMSIAGVDARGRGGDAVLTMTRGSLLETCECGGVACRFRSAYDVTLAPLALVTASFATMLRAPAALALPDGASAHLAIAIECTGSLADWPRLANAPLRVFIDAEQSLCAALRDALFMRVGAAWVEAGTAGCWHPLDTVPLAEVGFAEHEALIPFPPTAHRAYRLLTEYFAFPEKFNFFDIDLAALAAHAPPGCRRLTLHLALCDLHPDSDAARLLARLTPAHLRLFCTPVVNLFTRPAAPITLTGTRAEYTVLADGARPAAYEIHGMDKVQLVRASDGRTIDFQPYYSMRHGQAGGSGGHYWVARRDEVLAATRPGHEVQLALVDLDLDALEGEKTTVSVMLSCTNRDLPTLLDWGAPDGDLNAEVALGSAPVRFLRKPTRSLRFAGSAHWRLISQLSLNHRALAQEGRHVLAELLSLYDLPQSAVSQRQIAGISALTQQPARAWLDDAHGGALVHGVEIRLTLDETAFAGSGLQVFARVLDHFFGLYVHLNSFTELVVLSHQSGKELIRCQPRSGALNLV